MTRIFLLVEGQTEEAFVKDLLVEPFAQMGLYLWPIIVKTSPGHKGGVASFAKVRPQIERLCKSDSGAYVTTMFDLYALPTDFPGKATKSYSALKSGDAKAKFLEAALANDIGQRNFIANLLVHEFEALLFTDVAAFEAWTDDDEVLEPLRASCARTAPEDINDGPQTAPSKRILAAMPGYQKAVHGPLIAWSIGLDAMRLTCPHFDGWLTQLEELRVN